MNSRDRVLAAMDRQPVDRVPTDIWATPEVWGKLREHFGDDATARAELQIDGMANINAGYIGPELEPQPEGESIDFWGMRRRLTPHEGGAYNEQIHHPLAKAQTIDDLDAYTWPEADWFDTSQMRAEAEDAGRHQAVQCGYMAPFYYHNLLRGLETSLMDPLIKPDFTHALLERLCAYFEAHHRRMFEAVGDLIDVAQVTDDLGSQHGPLISMEIYRDFYAPWHQRFINLCHEFDIRVMHHDDGSCRLFLPMLIDMGIDVLHPIQWVCPGMDMVELKSEFGDRITFHGGMENQSILPFGTTDDVRAEVRHCIDSLMSDGTGYILAPCHNLQVVTPIENIIAMYDEAASYPKG